ncbi:hypothetical protein CASFOL_039951 [Castilleja foliolosa]|uniref:peptidylprolyl isomerase n=1 Tax=Castilleja foliolosa TaxID=1961234 RepID=A0ABD3BHI1_9LAMI
MAFWGVEVKPGKPITHSCENARGRLRISQATLGIGEATSKTIVQCNVGKRSPVLLCVLLPDKTESCHLDLEFEEPDDVVFSVIGPRSAYLTGYYVQKIRQSNHQSDTESYGVDIENTHTEGSTYCSDDEKYDDSFINDGAELQFSPLQFSPPRSPVNNDGMDDEVPENDKPEDKKDHGGQHRKKYCVIESDSDANTNEGEYEDDGQRSMEITTMTDDGEKNDGAYHIDPKEKVDYLRTNGEVEGETDLTLDEEKTEVRNEKNELDTVEGINVSNENALTGDTIRENSAIDTIDQMQSVDIVKPKKKRKQRSKGDKTCNIQKENSNMDRGENSEDGKKSKKIRNELGIDGINTEGTVKNCQNVLKDDEKSEEGSHHTDNLTRLEEICTEGIGSESCDIPKEDKSLQVLPHYDSVKENSPAETEEYQDGLIDNIINTINKEIVASDSQSKRKTKKKKKTRNDKDLNVCLTYTSDSKETTPENEALISKRILSNGLIIEELVHGPPDGKPAVPGKKVKIYFTAMLKETGHVFESNVGDTAYRFQLGDEDIIDGWNVGIEGMRVGDKRRLVIPPSMGFGDQGMGEKIPPNSWLVYEIELVGVRK